jgi:hypothetical protein
MSWMTMAGLCLTTAATVVLLVERLWRQRRWIDERAGFEQLAETLATQLGEQRTRADREQARLRSADKTIGRLASRLESKDLDGEDRQLLVDLYHEYGTDSHQYYFPNDEPGDEPNDEAEKKGQ